MLAREMKYSYADIDNAPEWFIEGLIATMKIDADNKTSNDSFEKFKQSRK